MKYYYGIREMCKAGWSSFLILQCYPFHQEYYSVAKPVAFKAQTIYKEIIYLQNQT